MNGTVEEILSKLVQIPSVNPRLAGGDCTIGGEARLAEFLANAFREIGAEVDIEEVEPGRPNVYAIFPGETAGKCRLWDIHTDTVGIEAMEVEPFAGTIKDGRVWGRGAVDTKASFAVALSLLSRGKLPRTPLVISCTIDEEVFGAGAKALSKWAERRRISFDEIVVAEPTGRCQPVRATNGLVRGGIRFDGKGAHTCDPHLGVNAAIAAAQVALAFANHHESLLQRNPVSTGHPKLTVTGLHGGGFGNTVTPSCTLWYDRRVCPGEDPEAIYDELLSIAQRTIDPRVTMSPAVEPRTLFMTPFETPENAPLVQKMSELSGEKVATAAYGTNGSYYEKGLGKEIVVLGPGSIVQAHKPDEYIDISELTHACKVLGDWLEL